MYYSTVGNGQSLFEDSLMMNEASVAPLTYPNI